MHFASTKLTKPELSCPEPSFLVAVSALNQSVEASD